MNKFVIINDYYQNSHANKKLQNELDSQNDSSFEVLHLNLKTVNFIKEHEVNLFLIELMNGLYEKREKIFKNILYDSNILIYYTNIPLSSKEWQTFTIYSKSNEKYKNLYMSTGNPKDESYRFIMRFEINHSMLMLINSELSWVKYFYDTTFNRKFLTKYFEWIEQDKEDAKKLIDLLYREVDEKKFPCFINTKITNLLDLREVIFTDLFIKKDDGKSLPSIKTIISKL